MSRWYKNTPGIKWLSLDVDGVLTDGRLYYGTEGEALKVFHARDGSAIKRWHQLGFHSLIISGRTSEMVRVRSQELGIQHVFLDVADKEDQLHSFCRENKVDPITVAHIGDDLPDLSLMLTVGIGISVNDGHPDIRAQADFITDAKGGMGAVSEAIASILQLQANI